MITYEIKEDLDVDYVISVYNDSGLGKRRPVHDKDRMKKMIQNSDILVAALDGDKLVGIARAISDLSYVTYLSDLAVMKKYQKKGIGKKLIEKLKEHSGKKTKIVVLSAPDAKEYYPNVGFEKHDSAWIRS